MLKEDKKQEIKNVVMKYAANNIFDITKFREENSKIYATIPYYFGSIDKMLDEFGLIRIQKSKNKVTFRNRLAYDYLKELREKHTLEEIANMYGVTRALINQQYQALELTIKVEQIEQEKLSQN
jgi:truncated hemoglobin YjbI